MWVITAQGTDVSHIEEATAFLRSKGFEVSVKEVNIDFAAIDLVEYLKQTTGYVKRPEIFKKRAEQLFDNMQSTGLRTLDDVTNVSVEDFWRHVPQVWRKPLLTLMASYKASFTDADTTVLLVEDINRKELNGKVYNSLKREGIRSLAILRRLPASVLLGIGQFGTKSLDEVRVMLGKHGLTLKGE